MMSINPPNAPLLDATGQHSYPSHHGLGEHLDKGFSQPGIEKQEHGQSNQRHQRRQRNQRNQANQRQDHTSSHPQSGRGKPFPRASPSQRQPSELDAPRGTHQHKDPRDRSPPLKVNEEGAKSAAAMQQGGPQRVQEQGGPQRVQEQGGHQGVQEQAVPQGVTQRRHRVKRIIKPGRVWSMSGQQEVALKQFWAILLKSFGYDINLSMEEIQSGTCMVASSKKTRSQRMTRRERSDNGADLNEADLSGADLNGAQPIGAEPIGAEPNGANPNGSNPNGANPNGANPNGANPNGANPNGANPNGARKGRRTNGTARVLSPESSPSSSQSSFVFQFSHNRIKSVFYSLETGSMDNVSSVFSFSGSSMHSTLTRFIGEDLHKSLWASCRNDNLDNYLLRLLREKEFHVTKALKMFAAIFDWRLNVHGVEDLLCKGDAHFYFEGKNPSLMQTLMRNEIFSRGKARNGEPLIYVRVRKHLRSNCPPGDYEKFLILIYEWVRLQFSESRSGIDQCQLIFDLTGFTMKNADMHAIRFLVKCHQLYFPHFVGTIYMHNAPRVFSVLWNVVVKWMNRRLRDVILFTHGYEQLHERIPACYIPRSLGGSDHDVPPFIEPNLYNFQRKVPDERFGDLVRERDDLTVDFIDATVKWIEASDPDESRSHLDAKIAIAAAKARNYILLDPYLRSRGVPDRNGEIGQLYY